MAQAGVEVRFLPIKDVNLPAYIHVSSNIQQPNSLAALAQTSGNGASPDPSVINLWFVKTIDNNPGAIGYALQTSLPFGILRPKNGIAIADSAFSFAGGAGMRDIFAHELGHNLGLYHGANESGVVLATGEQGLMSRAGSFPSGVDDIFPDGAQLSQINAAEAARIHAVSMFVFPLPLEEQYEYPPSATAPVLEMHPQSIQAHTGESVTLSTIASGSAPLVIDWYKEGTQAAIAHGADLTISPLLESHSAAYYAVVRNSAGAATSHVATVSVVPLRAMIDHTAAAAFGIRWEGLAGRSYKIESKTDINFPWSTAAEFPNLPVSGSLSWMNNNPPGEDSFFRISAE